MSVHIPFELIEKMLLKKLNAKNAAELIRKAEKNGTFWNGLN